MKSRGEFEELCKSGVMLDTYFDSAIDPRFNLELQICLPAADQS